MQLSGCELPRIPLLGTWVNKTRRYSSRLEDSSTKASRAFEASTRSGPLNPHAKHRAT
jgi:hypothetical protein